MTEATDPTVTALNAIRAWALNEDGAFIDASAAEKHLDAIAAALTRSPADGETVYPSLELCVQFSDDGRHIRKWSRIPFAGGIEYWSHPAPSQPAAEPSLSVERDSGEDCGRDEPSGEGDEAYEIGKRDGYGEALADVDRRTGGDGEYYASTIPGRGCPDEAAMLAKIVERFDVLTPSPTAHSAGMREGQSDE